MYLALLFALILYHDILYHVVDSKKTPKKCNETTANAKFDNPNYVRDRSRLGPNETKPMMPDKWVHRNSTPFNPAWMDYCDPYHCNDYHRVACGLNRDNMRFKWFQSTCHLILNNMCYYHRGLLRYDLVENKFCQSYVLQVRSGCPTHCDEWVDPVCAISGDNDVVLFRSRCDLERANCGSYIQPFEEARMEVCEYYWDLAFSE